MNLFWALVAIPFVLIVFGIRGLTRRYKGLQSGSAALVTSAVGLIAMFLAVISANGLYYSITLAPVTPTNREAGPVLMAFFFIGISGLVYLGGTLMAFVYNSGRSRQLFYLRLLYLALSLAALVYGPIYTTNVQAQREKAQKIQSGEIGGLTKEQAIEKSKTLLKEGVNYKFMDAKLTSGSESGAASWEVVYEVFDKSGNFVMNLFVDVSAKDGTIVELHDYVLTEFTFLNKGKPAVGWEAQTEWADPQDENSLVLHVVYDYGITDANGKISLNLNKPDSVKQAQQENEYLFVIYNKGEFKNFYKINQPFKPSYTVNLDDTSLKSL